MKNNSIRAHKEANGIIEAYVKKKSDYIFIHYARQNCFTDGYEKGPRVIAIVVMNAESEQLRIFSLRKTAEQQGKDFFQINEKEKDEIETELLNDFFEYVKINKEKMWLHWNMKNNNFGFSAIENRFSELNGKPYHLEESKQINISALLKKRYGTNFAKDGTWNGKVTGKMYDIFTLNNIKDTNILNGEEEIINYIVKNIMAIEQSVIAKLKAFQLIVEKTADNVLKTRGNILRDVYGFSIKGIAQYIQDNALLALLFSIIGGIISAVVCNIIGI